ncbi:MAG: sortase [Oscillospiraceae bacterium]|nr:sortase [Oscillospiraceae bacterium]
MKNKGWILVCLLGVLMIASAGLLCVYNIRQSDEAAEYAEEVLSELKDRIPEAPAGTEPDAGQHTGQDLHGDETESAELPEDIVIGEENYCGFISLPSLSLDLPVMSSWSYPNLKKAPCRYCGAAQTNDLIIAAHNYTSHFGKIGRLTAGDAIIFTDTGGRQYQYTVSFIEVIEGRDVEQMFSGQSVDWDLTLFTCTLGGKSRVTVRADRTGSDRQTADPDAGSAQTE